MSSSLAPNVIQAFQLQENQYRHVKDLSKIYYGKNKNYDEFHLKKHLYTQSWENNKQFKQNQKQKDIDSNNDILKKKLIKVQGSVQSQDKVQDFIKYQRSKSTTALKTQKSRNNSIIEENEGFISRIREIQPTIKTKEIIQNSRQLTNFSQQSIQISKQKYQKAFCNLLKIYKKMPKIQHQKNMQLGVKAPEQKVKVFEITGKVLKTKGFYKQTIELELGDFKMSFQNVDFKQKIMVVRLKNCDSEKFKALSLECQQDFNVFLSRVAIDQKEEKCCFLQMNMIDGYEETQNQYGQKLIEKQIIENNKMYESQYSFISDLGEIKYVEENQNETFKAKRIRANKSLSNSIIKIDDVQKIKLPKMNLQQYQSKKTSVNNLLSIYEVKDLDKLLQQINQNSSNFKLILSK